MFLRLADELMAAYVGGSLPTIRNRWDQGKQGPGGRDVRCVPLETCIIQHPKVWEASGHVGGFNDPMVDDKETKQRFRADHLCGPVPARRRAGCGWRGAA